MAKVIIRDVTISETAFNLRFEFDFALEDGGTAETYSTSISKPNYLFWKESADPANNSLLDYIQTLVQPHYERLLAQKELAVQLALKDKEITW